MEIIQAIILGIIEGITEFLPISSTGHLIVSEDLMNYQDAGKMFTVVIQMGAIAAVIWFYKSELKKLLLGLLRGDKLVRRFWLAWVIATIPAGIFGLIFNGKIDTYAVSVTVAIALIVGGIFIWLIETYHKSPINKSGARLDKLTIRQSVQVGLFQVLALIPGVSRSGATIMGGMLSGLDRVTATAFSFYLSIPVILVAGTYKLLTGDVNQISGGSPALIAGLLASFISALIAIKWLLKYVSSHDFKIFAYYRIALGCLLLVLISIGTLST